MRSALAHAPGGQRSALAAMLKTVFVQETKGDAEARRNILAGALRHRRPGRGDLADSPPADKAEAARRLDGPGRGALTDSPATLCWPACHSSVGIGPGSP